MYTPISYHKFPSFINFFIYSLELSDSSGVRKLEMLLCNVIGDG